MGECLQLGESPAYQQLRGLQEIRCLRDLTEDNVRDILRNNLRDDSLTIKSMGELTDMSGTNDAFNSSICSLQVTAETKEGGNGDETGGTVKSQTFHFVIKSPPKASFIRMSHKLSKPFLNEVTWYLELVKQIALIEKEFDTTEFKMSSLVPICYHAYSNYYWGEASQTCQSCPWFCCLPCRTAEEGILVMENVTKRGFKMFDKMKILPLDHFLLAMRNLAHFHGRWLAFRWLGEAGKLPEGAWTPDCLKQTLDTQKRVPKFLYKQLLSGTEKTVMKILELEGKTEYSDRIRKFFRVTAQNQLDQFKGEVSSPIDTCCHGDFWSNNIMFKYNDEDKVEDTILVDFQLINYGHPAYDVLYLLYLSSDQEFRDVNMDKCLQHYWNTFSTYLEKYSPEGVKYGWPEFMADIQVYKSIGFVLASTLLPNVLSDIQLEAGGLMALRDMQRKQAAELADDSKPSSREIKRRIIGLVTELCAQNIL